MKIQNLSKQLLLAAGVMAITFACQSKKSDSMQTPMEQSAPCDADDGSCGEEQDDMNSDQSDESTSAPQAPSEPVVEKSAAPSEAPTVAASKSEAVNPVSSAKVETSQPESAKPVTENRAETPSDSPQK